MKPSKHADGEPSVDPYEYRSDHLSPKVLAGRPRTDPPPEPDFTPVPVADRANGWTARRQRRFLVVLSETGSIREACIQAGVSSRSAYRLRARPDAESFAAGWDQALKLATSRLTALAFERATVGAVRDTWRHGELVSQTRQPSDKMLMFLLQHLLPVSHRRRVRDAPGITGRPGERWTGFEAMSAEARTGFPVLLDALADSEAEMVPLESRDVFAEAPGDASEDN